MSKKNRKQPNYASGPTVLNPEEYQIVRHDLVRVIILNIIYLVGVLALYYTNSQSHFLEKWFGGLLNF